MELMQTASKESFDTAVLQKKFDAWADDLLIKQQKHLQEKDMFLQKHHLPRVERDIAVQEYLEEYTRLRELFVKSTTNTQSATIRKWLHHAAEIPAEILQPTSSLYTMYPYEEKSFYSLPNVEKAPL